jgi:hypothetical protein
MNLPRWETIENAPQPPLMSNEADVQSVLARGRGGGALH